MSLHVHHLFFFLVILVISTLPSGEYTEPIHWTHLILRLFGWARLMKRRVQALYEFGWRSGHHRLLCNIPNFMYNITHWWPMYVIAPVVTCSPLSYWQCWHPLLTVNSGVPTLHSLLLVYCVYIRVLRRYFNEISALALFSIYVYKRVLVRGSFNKAELLRVILKDFFFFPRNFYVIVFF